MTEQRLFVPEPPRLDPVRLLSARFTIRAQGPNGPCLVHFDPERGAGAVLFLAAEVWAVYGPIEFGGFVATLADRQIVASDSDDLAEWIAACSNRPPCGGLN